MTTTSSGRLADLRACVEGAYSSEDLAAVLYEVAHAEAENGMLPTIQTGDYLDGVLSLMSGTGIVDATCDYCDERHAGTCEEEERYNDDGTRTGPGGEPEPEPRGCITLTYLRDPRVYCSVNLDDNCVEAVWSYDGDELRKPEAGENGEGLGKGVTLEAFNDAVEIAESDTWPSWS